MNEIALPYPIIYEIHAKRFLREKRTFTQLIIKCTVFYRTWRQIGSFESMAWRKIMAWMQQMTYFRYGVQLLSKQTRTNKKFGQSTRGLVSFL